jgi:fumarate reductase flavoprotein subunit
MNQSAGCRQPIADSHFNLGLIYVLMLAVSFKRGIIMSEINRNLSRRKFMVMSSTAIASRFILDAGSLMAASKSSETKTREGGIAPKGTKIYYIGNECVGCQVCKTFCPAQAIRFGDCKDEIDQKKCIHCGTCYRECPVSAITETKIGAPYSFIEKKSTATKVMDCDLVVLGAGGSGLFAAVKAFDLTGKKVIVLEKAKKPGGATYFAGGLGTVKDSTWAKEAGWKVSEPQHISGRIFDWFVSKGGADKFFKAAKPGENARSAIIEQTRTEKYKNLPDPSIGPGRGGSFIVDKMVECCQKQGIQILYETPARKFITDNKGKVNGVLADAKDGQLLVNCKACIIAAGGFGRNYEKLQKHWPEEFNNKEIFFLCPPGMMGDGIDMAEEIGAYIDQTKWPIGHATGSFVTSPIHHPYSFSLMTLTESGMFVSINLNGKRWKNESARDGISVGTQPGGVAYAVGDDEIVEESGSQRLRQGFNGPVSTAGGSESNESRSMKQWRVDIEYEAALDEEGAHGNHVKKADTLVELALKMQVDPRTFVETIERYNRFCETGKDLDFGKPAQALKAIVKPPFYAIYGHRFAQCTKGANGIAVNSKFEVLDKKGGTMPGLYAVGDTCTIYGGRPAGIGGGAEGAGADAAPAVISGAVSSGVPVDGREGISGAAPAAGVNILSTEPYPCNGSSSALISGYYAALGVADYLNYKAS